MNKKKSIILSVISRYTERFICPAFCFRYQLKCDELEKQRKDFDAQYSTLEKEKKDIVQYLKRALLEKEDEVDELSERLQSQRQVAEKDRDALQLQHSQQRQELQDRNDELSAVNVKLGEIKQLESGSSSPPTVLLV